MFNLRFVGANSNQSHNDMTPLCFVKARQFGLDDIEAYEKNNPENNVTQWPRYVEELRLDDFTLELTRAGAEQCVRNSTRLFAKSREVTVYIQTDVGQLFTEELFYFRNGVLQVQSSFQIERLFSFWLHIGCPEFISKHWELEAVYFPEPIPSGDSDV